MLNIKNKAFTLVELIVVITILAILGTIGFISLQGYSSEARDSKRVTDLGQIRTGIQVYQAKEGVVPEPNNAITVGSGSTIYTIQGYAGTGTLRSIKVNTDAKDPLEDNYYTYTTNGSKTKFQLLTLLENNNTAYNNIVPTTYANYENRESYSIGDQLGTLLEPVTNIPVQELGNNIDLSVNTTEYKTVFNKNDIQTLSGAPLYNEIVARSNGTGIIEETGLYSFASHTFTNCGQTGRTGPTLNQCTSEYNTTWDENTSYYNIVTQGYQEWIVPKSGTYRITAYGGQGGHGKGGAAGGLGAVLQGDFNLTSNSKLKLLVGQRGEGRNYSTSNGGGGGGGTFVAMENDKPLIVAGGGGGAEYRGTSGLYIGKNGNLATFGSDSVDGTGLGGQDGGSGKCGSCSRGCGGAGYVYNSSTALYCAVASQSFLNGGLGSHNNDTNYNYGGFGGGGGERHGGTGGGGYSGGGTASVNEKGGGGGGSFIASSALNPATSNGTWSITGTEPHIAYNSTVSNLNQWNTGHGKVIIEYIGN